MKVRDMMKRIEEVQNGMEERNYNYKTDKKLKKVLSKAWNDLDNIWIRLNKSMELDQ